MADKALAGRFRGRGNPLQWWHGVVLGLAVAWLPGPATVVFIYWLPLLLLYVLEPKNEGYRATAALFFVIAAMTHPVRRIWDASGDWDTCTDVLLDPRNLIMDWGAVALAWLVSELTVIGLRLYRAQAQAAAIRRLQDRARVLKEEWGFEPIAPLPEEKTS